MEYLLSPNFDAKVRIDLENDRAFVMRDGVESNATVGSNIVADATMHGQKISEKEYYSK
jgi:hypothetical protein